MNAVGFVVWDDGGSIAELLPSGEWRTHVDGEADPGLEEVLHALYDDYRCGPEYGAFGSEALADLARNVDGVLFLHPVDVEPFGVAS